MRYLLTFILLFVCSIVEASPAPNWVLGRGHSLYDPNQYLIGVGVSDNDYVSASESARAELIKSIRVKINSSINDYHSTDKSFSESTITSETDFLLEGSQVKDGWYDESKNVFYSLVVIKRKYILDTLNIIINNILTKNAMTMRQGDTYNSNGDPVKALVYYYDGYKESSKLFPYIQTYKSVILDPRESEIEDKQYNILFQEKIQEIVDNIELEKVDEESKNNLLSFNIKATYKGRSIDNLPIKFYSVYKHYVERVICKKDGCVGHTTVDKVVNRNNDIIVKAVVDIKTFSKLFRYRLDKKLFGRLNVLNVVFKARSNIPQNIPVQVRNRPLSSNERVWQKADRLSRQLYGCNPVCPGPYISNNVGNWRPNPRVRGNINFNIGFGNGRNRGNININRGW
tara:strand:- start:2294 stop:3490 length:1197 start_codon:yes stop_codon:yes gene_type:complete